jgi:hypothetical protein
MTTKRWSEDTAFCEVATPYNVKELMRSRLCEHGFEVTDFRGPDDKGKGALKVYNEKTRDTAVVRYHCPENYERLVRLARNIASTTGRKFGAKREN